MKVVQGLRAAMLGILAVPVLFGTARSDTLMSRAGKAYFGSDASCFFNYGWNGIKNSCSTTKTFESPINNRFGGGSRTFAAASLNDGSQFAQNPKCTAVVVSSGGAFVWAGSALDIGFAGSPRNLGSHSTSATDTFNVNCDILSTSDLGQALDLVQVN